VQKIPTMFERDWAGDKSRVFPVPNPECAWVFAREGVATLKMDGTSCLVRAGRLFKRRELRPGDVRPADFEGAGHDRETGKTVGWVPVGDGAEDRWHREAFTGAELPDGTYELLGPKVQGNPESYAVHTLERHGNHAFLNVPRDFDGLREWLRGQDMEGLVFHHPDGRMAKIKKRDFGLPRKP
jgi:hypothetical protein